MRRSYADLCGLDTQLLSAVGLRRGNTERCGYETRLLSAVGLRHGCWALWSVFLWYSGRSNAGRCRRDGYSYNLKHVFNYSSRSTYYKLNFSNILKYSKLYNRKTWSTLFSSDNRMFSLLLPVLCWGRCRWAGQWRWPPPPRTALSRPCWLWPQWADRTWTNRGQIWHKMGQI